ncbi:hypothetical protein DERP_006330 [Dermatophagoides pteronyssinus]|uniref:Uncharacterized protein n=1 Tax=Dermatophagoides pteronyssinus TaxID=6956 RepID=A0ABQ8IY50_DERPT|nr:hypothetical protein DERP_006330 [Dermatophagoides pteronyssinus]
MFDNRVCNMDRYCSSKYKSRFSWFIVCFNKQCKWSIQDVIIICRSSDGRNDDSSCKAKYIILKNNSIKNNKSVKRPIFLNESNRLKHNNSLIIVERLNKHVPI